MSFSFLRLVWPLALIMACRMLGLFMILPVFSVLGLHLVGATPVLLGYALGAYGLMQAGFQLPFGMQSDRFGRKPVIAVGLLLFIVGSVCCALSSHVWGVIIGRALQGMGAIGSTVMALVADVTPDEERSSAMAVIGAGIGVSFGVAMILGPLLASVWQLAGIFWLMAVLGGLALVLLYTVVPTVKPMGFDPTLDVRLHSIRDVCRHSSLWRLNALIGLSHAFFTALFLALPVVFFRVFNLLPLNQTLTYLWVMGLAFILMFPLVMLAEKKRCLHRALLLAGGLMLLALLMILLGYRAYWLLCLALVVFFTGFSLSESLLPSWVSKVAPLAGKGTAMGVYSTCQFFGIFVGASVGGWLLHVAGIHGVFIFAVLLALLALLLTLTLRQPPATATCVVPLVEEEWLNQAELLAKFWNIAGVVEVLWPDNARVVYVKYDRLLLDKQGLLSRVRSVTLDSSRGDEAR